MAVLMETPEARIHGVNTFANEALGLPRPLLN
jgi:hypothetical protein